MELKEKAREFAEHLNDFGAQGSLLGYTGNDQTEII